jgi:hypothetical protein
MAVGSIDCILVYITSPIYRSYWVWIYFYKIASGYLSLGIHLFINKVTNTIVKIGTFWLSQVSVVSHTLRILRRGVSYLLGRDRQLIIC